MVGDRPSPTVAKSKGTRVDGGHESQLDCFSLGGLGR